MSFEKAGYSPTVIRIQCKSDEEIDQLVVMRNQ